MGTLLPNFILKDAEDEFFFSSAAKEQENIKDNTMFIWKDDTLMEDIIEFDKFEKDFYLSSGNRGVYHITQEGKITT